MNATVKLRELAAGEQVAAPFAFEEFSRRREQARRRRRSAVLGIAGSCATLALVAVLAVVTRTGPRPQVVAPVFSAGPHVQETVDWPALVNVEQFDATSSLQDQIALLDAEISAARVFPVPADRLRQMESARAQLDASLQRVTYAHALLSL